MGSCASISISTALSSFSGSEEATQEYSELKKFKFPSKCKPRKNIMHTKPLTPPKNSINNHIINTTPTTVNMIVSSTTSSLFSMCEHYLELALSTALECTFMENLCKPNSQLVLDSIDSIQDPFDSELCEFGFAEPHFEHDLKEELLRMEKDSENRCINKSYVEPPHGCCRRPPYLIRNQKCSPQTTPFIVVSKIEKLQNSTSRYANRLHAPQESFLCPVDALR